MPTPSRKRGQLLHLLRKRRGLTKARCEAVRNNPCSRVVKNQPLTLASLKEAFGFDLRVLMR